jgi:zinc protease
MLRNITSRFLLLVVLLTALSVGNAPAQTATTSERKTATPASGQLSTTSPAAIPPTQFSDAQAALVTELDVNGLKVLVKRRAGSLTVATGLYFKGGSRNLTEKNAGIESLMLDVATEASSGFPREKVRSETSRMATVIATGANYDYSGISMGSTRANFDRSWEIFADLALRPSFTREDFERVQSRTVVSLRGDVDSPDAYLQRLQERVAYAGHPYANNPRGTAETVSSLTLEDVRKYHATMMQTSRLLLVLVGDLDASQVRERVAATFGKLPRGDYHPDPLAPLSFSAPTVEVTQRNLPTNYIQGYFVAPPLNADDVHAMRIASNILGQLVYQEVREKRNLSYAPDAFLSSQGANVGGISVTAVNANQAVGVMLDQIVLLQRNQLLPQIIRNTVAGYLTNYYIRQETNGAQAGELAQFELIGGGWRNSINIIDRLRAVTPEDVQRVSQKYMRNIRFVVLGNPASVDKNVFTYQITE